MHLSNAVICEDFKRGLNEGLETCRLSNHHLADKKVVNISKTGVKVNWYLAKWKPYLGYFSCHKLDIYFLNLISA